MNWAFRLMPVQAMLHEAFAMRDFKFLLGVCIMNTAVDKETHCALQHCTFHLCWQLWNGHCRIIVPGHWFYSLCSICLISFWLLLVLLPERRNQWGREQNASTLEYSLSIMFFQCFWQGICFFCWLSMYKSYDLMKNIAPQQQLRTTGSCHGRG